MKKYCVFIFFTTLFSFDTLAQKQGTIKIRKKDPCSGCLLTLAGFPSDTVIDTATIRHLAGPQIKDSTKCNAILEYYEISFMHNKMMYVMREMTPFFSSQALKIIQSLNGGEKIYIEQVVFDDLIGGKHKCPGSYYKIVNTYLKTPIPKKKSYQLYQK